MDDPDATSLQQAAETALRSPEFDPQYGEAVQTLVTNIQLFGTSWPESGLSLDDWEADLDLSREPADLDSPIAFWHRLLILHPRSLLKQTPPAQPPPAQTPPTQTAVAQTPLTQTPTVQAPPMQSETLAPPMGPTAGSIPPRPEYHPKPPPFPEPRQPIFPGILAAEVASQSVPQESNLPFGITAPSSVPPSAKLMPFIATSASRPERLLRQPVTIQRLLPQPEAVISLRGVHPDGAAPAVETMAEKLPLGEVEDHARSLAECSGDCGLGEQADAALVQAARRAGNDLQEAVVRERAARAAKRKTLSGQNRAIFDRIAPKIEVWKYLIISLGGDGSEGQQQEVIFDSGDHGRLYFADAQKAGAFGADHLRLLRRESVPEAAFAGRETTQASRQAAGGRGEQRESGYFGVESGVESGVGAWSPEEFRVRRQLRRGDYCGAWEPNQVRVLRVASATAGRRFVAIILHLGDCFSQGTCASGLQTLGDDLLRYSPHPPDLRIVAAGSERCPSGENTEAFLLLSSTTTSDSVLADFVDGALRSLDSGESLESIDSLGSLGSLDAGESLSSLGLGQASEAGEAAES